MDIFLNTNTIQPGLTIDPGTSLEILGYNSVGYSQTSFSKLKPGEDIQSNDFKSNISGWQIKGNGSAEFLNAVIRGALNADDITSGTMNAARINGGDINGVSITGVTITGGTIRTSSSGARVSISGNDIYLYDDTTGGNSSILGNVSTAYFPRTDGKNGTFKIQKRASANNDDGNVMEMYYEDNAINNGKNYIFIGLNGLDDSAYDMTTDVIRMHNKELTQVGTDSFFNITNGTPEIQICTPDAYGTSFNSGGSRVSIFACDSNVSAAYNPVTGEGGGVMALGLQTDAGIANPIWIDIDAIHTGGNIIPYSSNGDNLGGSSNYWKNIYTNKLQANSNLSIEVPIGNGIIPTKSGNTCGSGSYYWSDVYSSYYDFGNSGEYITYDSTNGISTSTDFKVNGNLNVTDLATVNNLTVQTNALTMGGRTFVTKYLSYTTGSGGTATLYVLGANT